MSEITNSDPTTNEKLFKPHRRIVIWDKPETPCPESWREYNEIAQDLMNMASGEANRRVDRSKYASIGEDKYFDNEDATYFCVHTANNNDMQMTFKNGTTYQMVNLGFCPYINCNIYKKMDIESKVDSPTPSLADQIRGAVQAQTE